MYCSTCGKALPAEKAQFCPSCGSKQAVPAANTATVSPPYDYPPDVPTLRRSGQGAGIAGLIVGLIGLFFGIYDYSLVQEAYDYILPEEIGILFILSALGIVFSSVGASRKSSIATGGLVISLLSLFLTFYLASIG
jgi:predicted RNA-binding Zn-ribbon protein involved in translation (DUF1610 family)